MADWEDADFEPEDAEKGAPAAVVTDRWAGEDVEDEFKDAWDEEDDKDSEEGTEGQAIQVKKKKPLKERIAEREAKKLAEAEEKRRKEENAKKELTSEEKLAEKLRQLQLQEESDLALAKEAFGTDDAEAGKGLIDAMEPSSFEDFEKFAQVLRDKVTTFETSVHYVSFLETLYRDLSVSLEPEDLKRLASTLNTLANEKSKVQKVGKGKKGKQKAKLHVGKSDNKLDDYGGGEEFGAEFDDFL